jgi:phosphoribosylformylglycinamidine (FGAM) synthase-like amidotransferase family enzyme
MAFKIPSPEERAGIIDAMDLDAIVPLIEMAENEVTKFGGIITENEVKIEENKRQLTELYAVYVRAKTDLENENGKITIAVKQLKQMQGEHKAAFRQLSEDKFSIHRRIKQQPR